MMTVLNKNRLIKIRQTTAGKVFCSMMLLILSWSAVAIDELRLLREEINRYQQRYSSSQQHKGEPDVLMHPTCHLHKTQTVDLPRIIREAATLHNLPPQFIAAVMQIESNFDPCAISSSGALGVMQIMPVNLTGVLVHNPFSVRENVLRGAQILSENLAVTRDNVFLALALYNGGSVVLDAPWDGWPAETQQYLRKFVRALDAMDKQAWSQAVPQQIRITHGYPIINTSH